MTDIILKMKYLFFFEKLKMKISPQPDIGLIVIFPSFLAKQCVCFAGGRQSRRYPKSSFAIHSTAKNYSWRTSFSNDSRTRNSSLSRFFPSNSNFKYFVRLRELGFFHILWSFLDFGILRFGNSAFTFYSLFFGAVRLGFRIRSSFSFHSELRIEDVCWSGGDWDEEVSKGAS